MPMVGLVLLASAPTAAQDPKAKPPQQRPTAQRLQALEDELAALKEAVGEGSQHATEQPAGVVLSGFGTVNYIANRVDPAGGVATGNNSFVVGELDLFLTSQMSERVSFLNETTFEFDSTGGSELDIERLIIKYEVSDHFSIQAGRFHTTLGYWNENYHHGEYLWTSVGRPAVLSLIPVHMVGLVFKGSVDSESVSADYTLEVGNGRAPTPGTVQNQSDANDLKAINFNIAIEPLAVEDLRVGLGAYWDDIPPNANPASASPLHGSIDEIVGSAYVVYTGEPWEVLAEYFIFGHDPDGASSQTSHGFYTQLGYRLGAVTPYFRYDGLRLSDFDRFFNNGNDVDNYRLGVRWDFDDWAALKLDLRYSVVDGALATPDRDEYGLALQCAFAF